MASLYFVCLAVMAGALIPAQASLNALLGKSMGHPLSTTLVVFMVGGVACVAGLLVVRPALPTPAVIGAAPVMAWAGGALAMLYVVAVVMTTPRIGVGLTTGSVLIGQMLMALALDHFGLLGNAVHPVNGPRALGLALMVVGLILIKRY